MQFRVIVATDPPTNTQTDKHIQDRLQYTAPQLSAQCNYHKLLSKGVSLIKSRTLQFLRRGTVLLSVEPVGIATPIYTDSKSDAHGHLLIFLPENKRRVSYICDREYFHHQI